MHFVLKHTIIYDIAYTNFIVSNLMLCLYNCFHNYNNIVKEKNLLQHSVRYIIIEPIYSVHLAFIFIILF